MCKQGNRGGRTFLATAGRDTAYTTTPSQLLRRWIGQLVPRAELMAYGKHIAYRLREYPGPQLSRLGGHQAGLSAATCTRLWRSSHVHDRYDSHLAWRHPNKTWPPQRAFWIVAAKGTGAQDMIWPLQSIANDINVRLQPRPCRVPCDPSGPWHSAV